MKLEHSFDVEAPIDQVWRTLIDIERVAPCLPGAEVTESSEAGVYEGSFQAKLGPTTASYAGKLQLEDVDEQAHKVAMRANGRDKRGQGSARATIVSTMSESAGTTHVEVVTDFNLTGKLARFGRGGMIQDVSDRLLGDFVACLKTTVGEERPGADGSGAQAGGDVADPGSAETPTSAAPSGAGGEAGGTVPGAPADSESVPPGTAEPAPSTGSGAARPAPRRQPQPARPVKGFSLLLSVLWGRIKRGLARLLGRRG